jgi:hypothetical protein
VCVCVCVCACVRVCVRVCVRACVRVLPLSTGKRSTYYSGGRCTVCERMVCPAPHTHLTPFTLLPPFHPTPALPRRSQWTGHNHADATGLQLKTLQTTLKKLQSGEISKVELSKCLHTTRCSVPHAPEVLGPTPYRSLSLRPSCTPLYRLATPNCDEAEHGNQGEAVERCFTPYVRVDRCVTCVICDTCGTVFAPSTSNNGV